MIAINDRNAFIWRPQNIVIDISTCRSHSGGDDHSRRDRKKGKPKRKGPGSPDDGSPSKKSKRHSR